MGTDGVGAGEGPAGEGERRAAGLGRPLRAGELEGMSISMADFEEAVGKVQPSIRREGFSTTPGVTWSDVGALEDVREELRQLELAGGACAHAPELLFARHPHEVEVRLDPRWMLVWNPSTWHATGVKTAEGRRRAMSWNYFPVGGRKRDSEALKYFYAREWAQWSSARQRLWGLVD